MLCFYQVREFQLRGLIILIFLLLSLQHLEALFSLPQNVRVDSELEINAGNNSVETYSVEELIDREDGSIRLRVSDLTKSAGLDELTSYFRIRELSDGVKNINNLIVSFNHIYLECQSESTKSWQLKELSHLTSMIWEMNTKSEMLAIRDDRTAIGPTILLRIVRANAHLFTFKLKAFDETHLNNMYYFMATLPLHHNQVVKIICSFPEQLTDFTKLQVNDNLISALRSTNAYPTSVIVVVVDKDDEENIDMKSLISGNDEKLKATRRINANFYLIQERLSSRHMGLKLGSLDELNPFTLPSSAGCGVATRHSLFYVDATLFSGLFEAKDSKTKRFIAYDMSGDRHLRIDSIGNYKMIYNSKIARLTYIDDSSNPSNEGDKITCAQTYQLDTEQDDLFLNIKAPEDILGFAKYTGLLYLGTMTLEDGSHCLVFEREIAARQIPLISRLTLRINVRATNRFFLVYYFIDELAVETKTDTKFSYETLWLKRIELTSISPVSKYKILNSQVTFSESTWSLESEPEDNNNLERGIRHPVRTFDIIECASTRDQTELEFLIRQQNNLEDNNDDNKTRTASVDVTQLLNERLEFVEESVMSFLSLQKSLTRSHVCELEVVPPRLIGSGSGSSENVLVKAKLVDPSIYSFERQLVGWIYNIDSVPLGKYATMISSEPMSRVECSMKLAVQMGNSNIIHILYCPNIGCGYIHDYESLEITSKSTLAKDLWPTISDNYYLCEIHTQTRDVGVSKRTNEKISTNIVERLINGSRIHIDTDPLNNNVLKRPTNDSPLIKGFVVKILAKSRISQESLGASLVSGFCYTKQSQVLDFDTRIQELHFQYQHSLIHCHKACQIRAACQTYSYDKNSRTCTLTNIPEKYVTGSETQGLREDENCTIFAIDSIQLYRKVLETMLNSLDGLSKSKNNNSYVTIANLTECANLCHLNEFTCESFEHFPLKNYCFLVDKHSFFFPTIHPELANNYTTTNERVEWMVGQIGWTNWFAMHKSDKYKRDYVQHYGIEQSVKVDLEKLPKSLSSSLSQQTDAESNLQTSGYSLVAGPLFYGLDNDACLRECTIINSNCIMVDHCLKPINAAPTRICSIYELKNTTISQTGADTKFNLKNNSKSLIDSLRDRVSCSGCTHYYLDGDNLRLKLQLMGTFQLDKLQESERIEEKTKDLDGVSYHEELTKYAIEETRKVTSRSFGSRFMSSIFFLFVGLSFGSLLTLYAPHILFMKSTLKTTITRLSSDGLSLWCSHKRTERSQSKIEFNELDDIHNFE